MRSRNRLLTLGRRSLLAGSTALLAAPAIVRAQARNVALVIGNSKYQWEASLPNVKRDAPDIARRFEALGMQTELLMDVGRGDMKAASDRFLQTLKGADFAAFYFAGHGAQWGRDIYLVPVDADLSTPNTVSTLFPVPTIRAGMAGARHGLIALDNCRNNPADGWRQREALDQAGGRGDGSAGSSMPPNTLMLFSTAPGRVAVDGPPGENSPFAAALLRQLDGASVELQGMAPRLRRDLLIATQGRQILWDRDTYNQPFRLAGKPEAASRRPATGGWAADPSRIVELYNAYAFAQQNALPLPAGLIAHRARTSDRDGMKIGAFTYTTGEREPALLIVMSVEERQGAELIMSTRIGGQPGWRFIQGNLSGDAIDIIPKDGGRRHLFTWRDSAGGNITIFPRDTKKNQAGIQSLPFTRIDG